MSPRRLYTLLAASTIGVLLLIALGLWQLERLEWKRALLADLSRAIASDSSALDLTEAEAVASQDPSRDFLRVIVRGTFDHRLERYLFPTRGGSLDGRSSRPSQPPAAGWFSSIADCARCL